MHISVARQRLGQSMAVTGIARARPEPDATPVRQIERVQGGQPLPRHLHGAIVALGNFDGFHLGHQEVARQARALAHEQGVATIIATFDPHPVRFFRPDHAPFRLTSLDQRQRAIAAAGMDAMMVFRFDHGLASASPASFVHDWLPDIGGVVTGADFSFGGGRSGDIHTLRQLLGQRGLRCLTVSPVERDGMVISSSRIRHALENGDCATAAKFMTRPFALEGRLVSGSPAAQDFPMLHASMRIGDYARARPGVYAVRARMTGGRTIDGSAYLGGEAHGARRAIELFIADLEQTDLGSRIEVELIAHLYDADQNQNPAGLRRDMQDHGLHAIRGPDAALSLTASVWG